MCYVSQFVWQLNSLCGFAIDNIGPQSPCTIIPVADILWMHLTFSRTSKRDNDFRKTQISHYDNSMDLISYSFSQKSLHDYYW